VRATADGSVSWTSPRAADIRLVPLASTGPRLGALYKSLGGDPGGGIVLSRLVAQRLQLCLAGRVLPDLPQPGCFVGSHPARGQDLLPSGRQYASSIRRLGRVKTVWRTWRRSSIRLIWKDASGYGRVPVGNCPHRRGPAWQKNRWGAKRARDGRWDHGVRLFLSTRACELQLGTLPERARPCGADSSEPSRSAAPLSKRPPGRGLCHHWRPRWFPLPEFDASRTLAVAAARSLAIGITAKLSLPCPVLDRPRLLPLTVRPTTSALRSTFRLFSMRRKSHRRASTLRSYRGVALTMMGGLRVEPHRRRATRGRGASLRIRGQALTLLFFAVATHVSATRRRNRVHCEVTCSVDPRGRVC